MRKDLIATPVLAYLGIVSLTYGFLLMRAMQLAYVRQPLPLFMTSILLVSAGIIFFAALAVIVLNLQGQVKIATSGAALGLLTAGYIFFQLNNASEVLKKLNPAQLDNLMLILFKHLLVLVLVIVLGLLLLDLKQKFTKSSVAASILTIAIIALSLNPFAFPNISFPTNIPPTTTTTTETPKTPTIHLYAGSCTIYKEVEEGFKKYKVPVFRFYGVQSGKNMKVILENIDKSAYFYVVREFAIVQADKTHYPVVFPKEDQKIYPTQKITLTYIDLNKYKQGTAYIKLSFDQNGGPYYVYTEECYFEFNVLG